MNKSDIVAFFDRMAPQWDADMIRDDAVVSTILDNAGVSAGDRVLDVACGTGVLLPDYLQRQVGQLTGIDISPEMIRIAREKCQLPQVEFICGDVETTEFDGLFDRVVVYNAFPHFPEPAALIRRLSTLLRVGGTLTVAHGMSREQINRHHEGAASHVSMGLISEQELAELFRPYFDVTVMLSNEKMYQVVGKKI